MLRGLFVTGTDTGVGKTLVSAALLHRFRDLSGLHYWKPVQTGIETDDDTAEVLRLSGLASDRALHEGVRLRRPLSPHLSAALAGSSIAVAGLIVDLVHRERGLFISPSRSVQKIKRRGS